MVKVKLATQNGCFKMAKELLNGTSIKILKSFSSKYRSDTERRGYFIKKEVTPGKAKPRSYSNILT